MHFYLSKERVQDVAKVVASNKAPFDLLKKKTKSENFLEGYGITQCFKESLKCNSET